jgi:predicted kinase
MATSIEPTSTRTVVLLRPAERKRLEKLATAEHVSAGEILRRSLQAYEKPASDAEEEILTLLVAQMNSSLDEALVSLRTARSSIRESLDKIDAMQREQAQLRKKREK